MTEPLRCGACGSDEISHGFSAPPFQGIAECHADGCEVLALAKTEAQAVAALVAGQWTHRVINRDADGNPERAARREPPR